MSSVLSKQLRFVEINILNSIGPPVQSFIAVLLTADMLTKYFLTLSVL